MRRFLCFLLGVTLLVPTGGCTRHFFRGRADKEVDCVIADKDQYPEWGIEQFHVYPDPRARFADWTDPDRPPMPPDDPAARALSPAPQKPGKAGVQYIEGTGWLDLLAAWDAENRAEEQAHEAELRAQGKEPHDTYGASGFGADPTKARDVPRPLRTNERPFRIKLDQAVAFGQINSREFQSRREDLYLAALPVTLERFAFAAQGFAFGDAIRERLGAERRPGAAAERWNFSNTQTGFSKVFSTGALLLLRFANRTVINLTGSDERKISESNFNLDIVQPFLRGGGRAVTLEPLTQSERDLLYEIRDYYRFRQEFYVSIAAGDSFGSGTVGGVGAFATFSPTPGVAGIRPVEVSPGAGARLGTNAIAFTSPQGYLPTVLQQAILSNQYKNIERLAEYARNYPVFMEGGIVNQLQVNQVEQTLLNSTNQLLGNEANLRVALDQFKLQLGVPPIIPIELDDSVLEPLYDQTQRYDRLTTDQDQLLSKVKALDNPKEVALLRQRLRSELTTSPFVEGLTFPTTLKEKWASWEKQKIPTKKGIVDRLSELRKERRPLLDRESALADKAQPAADKAPTPEEEQQLAVIRRELAALRQEIARRDFDINLGEFELTLREYEEEPWLKLPVLDRPGSQQRRFGTVLNGFFILLELAYKERQERLRQNWPELPALCVEGQNLLRVDYDEALAVAARTALTSRVDLMNTRAQLVDSWRKIAVTANSLLGVFNVQYHMDSFTPLGEAIPLGFSESRTRHQLILSGELPLVRLPERNSYRIALIAYQRQRRALMAAEDAIVFSVRSQLNQLRALRDQYERVQKRAVELAYEQADGAYQAVNQPVVPDEPPRAPGAVRQPRGAGLSGGDSAALTQQLLSAQSSLLNAQNNLYGIWIEYQTRRMSLYRDLGLMPLDNRGVWSDVIATSCEADPERPEERPDELGPQPRVEPDPGQLPLPNVVPPELPEK